MVSYTATPTKQAILRCVDVSAEAFTYSSILRVFFSLLLLLFAQGISYREAQSTLSLTDSLTHSLLSKGRSVRVRSIRYDGIYKCFLHMLIVGDVLNFLGVCEDIQLEHTLIQESERSVLETIQIQGM